LSDSEFRSKEITNVSLKRTLLLTPSEQLPGPELWSRAGYPSILAYFCIIKEYSEDRQMGRSYDILYNMERMQTEHIPVPIAWKAFIRVTGGKSSELAEAFKGTRFSHHRHMKDAIITEEEIEDLVELYNAYKEKKRKHNRQDKVGQIDKHCSTYFC